MVSLPAASSWPRGSAPVAVVMICLNEGHNMETALQNLKGWAQEVFLVDSYSQDDTVDIALCHGVHVVQRRFRDFGDQWNFALSQLPITAPWTMKLDPDERLTDSLKREIEAEIQRGSEQAYYINIRQMFMGRALPVLLNLQRLWRTGRATMSAVSVNEHILVQDSAATLRGEIEHHDSPDLDHWFEKQNRYSTDEAKLLYQKAALSDRPRLFGNRLQRRMWLKTNFYRIPGRYILLFMYYWLWKGTWRQGWVGYAWARLRADVMRMREYKAKEMQITGRLPANRKYGAGAPDPRVPQYP